MWLWSGWDWVLWFTWDLQCGTAVGSSSPENVKNHGQVNRLKEVALEPENCG